MNNQALIGEFTKMMIPRAPALSYKGPVNLATALGLQKVRPGGAVNPTMHSQQCPITDNSIDAETTKLIHQ
jgi:hypothetical protein